MVIPAVIIRRCGIHHSRISQRASCHANAYHLFHRTKWFSSSLSTLRAEGIVLGKQDERSEEQNDEKRLSDPLRSSVGPFVQVTEGRQHGHPPRVVKSISPVDRVDDEELLQSQTEGNWLLSFDPFDMTTLAEKSVATELGQREWTNQTGSSLGLGQSIYSSPSLLHLQGPTLFPLNTYQHPYHHRRQQQQQRQISSMSNYLPSLPEFAQHWTIWGGSGWILKTLHMDGKTPYWACMALTNIIVRSALVPLVLQAAHTSIRFAKVAPEVQFLVSSFQRDIRHLKEQNRPPREQMVLMKVTYQTLRQIYKLHRVNPLDVFKSPLMQIPIFWYFSIDIRKIINGADPELAQQLTESGFLWITDLTDPDPWYGLPVVSGALLYLNVELAIGKKSLSGETASRSNIARILKDFFQSLAVFMPCFMSQSPAGVQIYLATSFVFTMAQGAALRNDTVRAWVGLPAMNAPHPEPILVKEFLDLKKKEQEVVEARGDKEVLGRGVLAHGFQLAYEGTARPSTIVGSVGSGTVLKSDRNSTDASSSIPELRTPSMMVYGQQSNLMKQDVEQKAEKHNEEPTQELMPQIPEEVMEAANRGEAPPRPVVMAPVDETTKRDVVKPLNVKKFIEKRNKSKLKKGVKRKPNTRKR